MENHFDLSQSRGTCRCGGNDKPSTSEKKAPRHPASDVDKGGKSAYAGERAHKFNPARKGGRKD